LGSSVFKKWEGADGMFQTHRQSSSFCIFLQSPIVSFVKWWTFAVMVVAWNQKPFTGNGRLASVASPPTISSRKSEKKKTAFYSTERTASPPSQHFIWELSKTFQHQIRIFFLRTGRKGKLLRGLTFFFLFFFENSCAYESGSDIIRQKGEEMMIFKHPHTHTHTHTRKMCLKEIRRVEWIRNNFIVALPISSPSFFDYCYLGSSSYSWWDGIGKYLDQ